MATYITNPKQFNGMWAFIITIAIALIVVLASCNPTRRVIADKDKLEQVGRVWAAENPCINDTITRYLAGRTDTLTRVQYDTTYYEYTDTVERVVNRTETRYITRRDTILRTIEDGRKLSLLAKDHSAEIEHINTTIVGVLRDNNEQLSADLDTMTERRDKWRIWFFRLLAVNLVALLIWQRKRIRKIIA
jgi:hypothetical protein